MHVPRYRFRRKGKRGGLLLSRAIGFSPEKEQRSIHASDGSAVRIGVGWRRRGADAPPAKRLLAERWMVRDAPPAERVALSRKRRR